MSPLSQTPRLQSNPSSLAWMISTPLSIVFVFGFSGGRIDHGHHDGIAHKALTDTIAMAKAVTKALSLVDQGTKYVTNLSKSDC